MRGIRGALRRTLSAAAIIAAAGAFSFGAAALAQSPGFGVDAAGALGLASGDLATTITSIIRAALGLLGLVGVAIVIYGGFRWMTSGGDEAKVKKARDTIRNGLVGLLIILLAYAIVAFVTGAVSGSGTTTSGGGGGGGFTPNLPTSAFRLTSTSIYGSRTNNGWPRNSQLWLNFSSTPNLKADGGITVAKCGAFPGTFKVTDCVKASGQFSASGTSVRFTPAADIFDANSWYLVNITPSSALVDSSGQKVQCATIGTPDWESDASGWCQRAFAINDVIDTSTPTVTLNVPQSGGYCGSELDHLVMDGTAHDATKVAKVEFKLSNSNDMSSILGNVPAINPGDVPDFTFPADVIAAPPFIDGTKLDAQTESAGASYVLTAIATNVVGKASAPAQVSFPLRPSACCSVGGQTACGPENQCGKCDGSTCTKNADCFSGQCDLAKKTCVSLPEIDATLGRASALLPAMGGPGSLITITGKNFGTTPGTVTFMGPPAVTGQTCASGAWQDDQVTVIVPDGAKSGPIKLARADGAFDTTDDAHGWRGAFALGDSAFPGICTITPSAGATASQVAVTGSGFPTGANLLMGGRLMATSGWTGTSVTGTVPTSIAEQTYPVDVSFAVGKCSKSPAVSCTAPGKCTNPTDGDCLVGSCTGDLTLRCVSDATCSAANAGTCAAQSNEVAFTVTPTPGSVNPVILSMVPTEGPPGTFVTIIGKGFGSQTGTVTFQNGATSVTGAADFPQCSNNWTPNYIIVKVPQKYTSDNSDVSCGGHGVTVKTAGPDSKTSNAVNFNVDWPSQKAGCTMSALKPGICSITPDNGPVSSIVTVTGDGFSAPVNIPQNLYSLDFYQPQAASKVAPANYNSWNSTTITSPVPVAATTGPVFVTAENQKSSNVVPFTVQNCNTLGGDAFCSKTNSGDRCCPTGSCSATCQLPNTVAAYAWKFSTGPLPDVPIVVEQSQCSNGALQSPSPSNGATDACTNSEIHVTFDKVMDHASINDSTVHVDQCDDDTCANPTALSNLSYDIRDGNSTTDLYISAPIAATKKYRVTLSSSQTNGPSIVSKNAPVFKLDGDGDGREGGDYVFSFTTGAGPCNLADVQSVPQQYTIGHRGGAASPPGTGPSDSGFAAVLLASNCDVLRCQDTSGASLYAMAWSFAHNTRYGNPILQPASGATGDCLTPFPVTADQETVHGSTVDATVSVTDKKGMTSAKTSTSAVSADFGAPTVDSYAPNCNDACPNAAISAVFSKAMDPATISGATITINECRNVSCNAPYVSTLDASATLDPNPLPDGKTKAIIRLPSNVRLNPNTYYRVAIKAGVNGAKSTDGVSISNINHVSCALANGALCSDPSGCPCPANAATPACFVNEGESSCGEFIWVFKTQSGSNACVPERTVLTPATITFTRPGEMQTVTATVFSKPDACSSTGEELDPWSYDWASWKLSNQQPPAASSSFADSAVIARLLTGNPSLTVRNTPADTDPAGVAARGCSGQCTYAGSQPITTPVCGNGVVEAGEDPICEAGKFASGISCDLSTQAAQGCKRSTPAAQGCDPATCLVKHLAACTPSTHTNCCGDGILFEPGKTCEAVNGVFPPGCADPKNNPDDPGTGCYLLGATAGKSVCGNGLPGDGKSCDNGTSGASNGCSADCLNTGSAPACDVHGQPAGCVSRCGDHVAQLGEDPYCEQGANPASQHCDTLTCLRRSDFNFCHTSGQQCAAGSVGCTNNCLFAGSSSAYYPPTASFCGDGVVSSGEVAACENTSIRGDHLGDPTQVFISGAPSSAATANLVATPKLPAGSNPAQGTSQVNYQCSCDKQGADAAAHDLYCNGGSATSNANACGAGGCCAARPTVVAVVPSEHLDCLNSRVSITFDQIMDHASTEAAVSVAKADGTAVKGKVSSVDDADAGRTTVNFDPDQAFETNANYTIAVAASALSANKVSMDGGYSSRFNTSQAQLCTIARVVITPASSLYSNTADAPTIYTAQAISNAGDVLASLPSYHWDWRWQEQPVGLTDADTSPLVLDPVTDSSNIVQTDKQAGRIRGTKPADHLDHPKNGRAKVQVFADIPAQSANPTASSVLGSADATVMVCNKPWPAFKVCTDSAVASGTVVGHMNGLLPWDPNNSDSCVRGDKVWYPYYDPASHIAVAYCRDPDAQGGPDLPDLNENAAIISPGRGIIKEFLFSFADPTIQDAIGIRLSKNLSHLGPLQWYTQQGFKGSPQAMTVDGFDGVQDGRTAYVGAPSLLSTSPFNTLFTNIVTFSYTDRASQPTIDIFGRMLQFADMGRNLTNNRTCIDPNGHVVMNKAGDAAVGCSADVDCQIGADGKTPDISLAGNTCSATKDKLARDLRRWSDVAQVRSTLAGKTSFPALASGSFLRGKSVSTWPSWSATLGTALGGPLPSDPLNAYGRNGYCSGMPSKACTVNADCGTTPNTCITDAFDAATSWDATDKFYRCPVLSHVYSYSALGGGSDYAFQGDFETGCSQFVKTANLDMTGACAASTVYDPGFCQVIGNQCTSTFKWNGPSGASALVAPTDKACIERDATECLPHGGNCEGDPSNKACNSNADCTTAGTGVCKAADCYWDQTSNPPSCQSVKGKVVFGNLTPNDLQCNNITEGASGRCGDGIIQDGEECEPGISKPHYQSCTAGGFGGFQQTEICGTDCKYHPAVGACIGSVCGDGIVKGTSKVCDDGKLNGTYGHCNSTCTAYSAKCGDGNLDPGERCDCGALNGAYTLNGVLQSSCPAGQAHWWRAESVKDSSDAAGATSYNDLTLVNGATITSNGVVGKGFLFNGVASYAWGHGDFAIGPYTVGAWIAPDAQPKTYPFIYAKNIAVGSDPSTTAVQDNENGSGPVVLMIDNRAQNGTIAVDGVQPTADVPNPGDDFIFRLRLQGACGGGKCASDTREVHSRTKFSDTIMSKKGRPTYVTGVYDGSSISIYIDGQKENTVAVPSSEPLMGANGGVSIGNYMTTFPNFSGFTPDPDEKDSVNGNTRGYNDFKGVIDEISFYTRALSDEQVASLLNCSGTQQCTTDGANASSCSWDCKEPAPRCGDGIVNGAEQCDGGVQESTGVCMGAGGPTTACARTSDCAKGESCATCPGLLGLPQGTKWRRACGSNDPTTTSDDSQACMWNTWQCATSSCGNGIKEPGEECDLGDKNSNTGACTLSCKLPKCGDGLVQASNNEQCDNGSQNGVPCNPAYGSTCNYCSSACRVLTVSGGFCGDGVVTKGVEACDGAAATGNTFYCVQSAVSQSQPSNQSMPISASPISCNATCSGNICPTGYNQCVSSDPTSTNCDGLPDDCDPNPKCKNVSCDASLHLIPDGHQGCTCDAANHYVSTQDGCDCAQGYVQSGGRCVLSV